MRVFRVEGILTVAHGHLFLAAATVASRLGVPLHVIIHDDWPTITPGGTWPGSNLHARFREVYSRAASRLCVSPYMEEEYRRRYGVAGSVLLPCRDAGTVSGRVRVRMERRKAPVLAFAGALPNGEYVLRLRQAAAVMASLGGRLDLYTNVPTATLERIGLDGPPVRQCGFLPPRELHDRIGNSADALLLPMSFAPSDRPTMSLCFPSKLTEYTAIGLPIVAWGPAYSAGVRWIRQHGGGEAVVETPDTDDLRRVIEKVALDPEVGVRLAGRLVEAGNQQLTFETAVQLFRSALGAGTANGRP